MNRRRALLAASQQSGGGGGNLNFPIVITTDYCEEGGGGTIDACYKNLADDGAFYDALFQFLKDNTMYPEYDDYYEYESSEPIIVIDDIGFSNIFWFEGDEFIASETEVSGKIRVLFIYSDGMIELEKWR